MKFEEDLRRFGIPYYVVTSVYRDIPVYGDGIYIYSNWPSQMLDIWDEQKGFALDPIVQFSQTATEPFFWKDAVQNTTRTSARLFKIAQSYGLKEGYVVPRRDECGELKGGASIGGTTFPYAAEELAPITALCNAVLTGILDEIDRVPPTLPKLSKQEREVLRCAARGESIQGISNIMRISRSAVKDAQSRARQKLRAKNTTHACVVATQLNLI